jgi:uncharacterized protein (TIGR02646 family)
MKHIVKQREPETLAAKRNTTGTIYDGPQLEWQEQLLAEQGHICAYCMQRISLKRKNGKPMMEIEHFQPREDFSNLQLVWTNMLGVCNGFTDSSLAHCDKTQGKAGKMNGTVSLEALNPLDKKVSEDIITYNISGEIIANTQNEVLKEKVKHDLNTCLNLNNEQLCIARKNAIDDAKKRLQNNYPNKTWTQKDLDKEIAHWKTKHNDKYQPYCQVAIWFLEFLKQKPVYK